MRKSHSRTEGYKWSQRKIPTSNERSCENQLSIFLLDAGTANVVKIFAWEREKKLPTFIRKWFSYSFSNFIARKKIKKKISLLFQLPWQSCERDVTKIHRDNEQIRANFHSCAKENSRRCQQSGTSVEGGRRNSASHFAWIRSVYFWCRQKQVYRLRRILGTVDSRPCASEDRCRDPEIGEIRYNIRSSDWTRGAISRMGFASDAVNPANAAGQFRNRSSNECDSPCSSIYPPRKDR